jgi:hypothetical protein
LLPHLNSAHCKEPYSTFNLSGEDERPLWSPAYQDILVKVCQQVACGCSYALHNLLCAAERERKLELQQPKHKQAATKAAAAAAAAAAIQPSL